MRIHDFHGFSLWGLLGLIFLLGVAFGDEGPDRAKVEAEAIGQAAEADRLFKAGDFASALPLYEAERGSRAALGDVRFEAYANRAIGCCHERLGDFEAAIIAWEAARRLDARREDKGFEGYDIFLIGRTHFRLGRPEEAEKWLIRAIPLLSTAIDRDHEIDVRLVLARVLTDLGRPEEAPEHLDRARSLATELSDAKRLGDAYAESARVAMARDDPGPASEWLSDARDAYDDQGSPAEAAAMARILGDVLLELGHRDAAAARVELAAEVHERLQDMAGLAGDLQFLAALQADAGHLDKARGLALRMVKARDEADDPSAAIEARILLARYESLANAWDAAAATVSQAVELVRREDSEPSRQVRLLILAADVERRARHADRVGRLLDEAGEIADRDDNGALKRLVTEARDRAR